MLGQQSQWTAKLGLIGLKVFTALMSCRQTQHWGLQRQGRRSARWSRFKLSFTPSLTANVQRAQLCVGACALVSRVYAGSQLLSMLRQSGFMGLIHHLLQTDAFDQVMEFQATVKRCGDTYHVIESIDFSCTTEGNLMRAQLLIQAPEDFTNKVEIQTSLSFSDFAIHSKYSQYAHF